MRKCQRGFTMMELMVVLVIIGILAALVYPSYTGHVVKTRRAAAEAALLTLAANMETYYNQNNSYAGATLANVNSPTTTQDSFYTLSINTATASTFTIRAVPVGTQATNDAACGTLTYDQLGTKGITGSGNALTCWGN